MTEYERFVAWFTANGGARPTRRQVMQNADELERLAAKKREKAKHGGISNKARVRALDRCDELELVAIRLRSSAPNAIQPCTCECNCGDACADYESKCQLCLDGRHYDHHEALGAPYLGSVFGS